MDKQAKKKARAVVDKYTLREQVGARLFGSTFPVLTAAFGIFTGAFGSVITGVCCVLTMTASAALAFCNPLRRTQYPDGVCNYNGQQVEFDMPWADRAFDVMERRLQAAFSKAVSPEATAAEKKGFLDLAREVTEDAEALAPVTRVTYEAVGKGETGRYEFVIERPVHLGIEFLTLDKARAEVRKTALKAVRACG